MTISPSEALGSATEYEQIRQNVLPILELEGDDFLEASGQFIGGRVNELKDGAVSGALGKDGNFQGFLGPDLEINAAGLVDTPGFVLDDPKIYSSVMPVMQQYYKNINEQLNDPARAYRNAVYATAQRVQELYFSSPDDSVPSEGHRDNLFTRATERISVAAFKGVAKCVERAAVANNIVRLFGVNPVLEVGDLKIGDDMPIPHAFLLVPNSKGEVQLFDPTNPILVFNEAGGLVQTSPAMYPIEGQLSSARAATVLNPVPITVMHRNYHLTGEGRKLEQKPYHFTLALGTPDLRPY